MAILIAYFSHKGMNYCHGVIKDLKKGNTEIVAEYIKTAVGGDLFEIDTVKVYPNDYHACCDEAQKELVSKARPELKNYLDSIDKYDTIFLGYPNWWGTIPMAVCTFLEHYDLTGKRIIPFCTNEGSGMGRSEKDLKAICKGATVVEGQQIRGSAVAESKALIYNWAHKCARK